MPSSTAVPRCAAGPTPNRFFINRSRMNDPGEPTNWLQADGDKCVMPCRSKGFMGSLSYSTAPLAAWRFSRLAALGFLTPNGLPCAFLRR